MSNDRNKIVNFSAFVALVLSAALMILTKLELFSDKFLSILSLLQYIALLVGISFAGYNFVRSTKNKKVWLIVYWASVVIFVIFAILPVIKAFK